jgi:hypothetical protein
MESYESFVFQRITIAVKTEKRELVFLESRFMASSNEEKYTSLSEDMRGVLEKI